MQWSMSAMLIVLADFADALASLLGLRMLRLASCCKACQHAFDHDPRIWGALLQYEINFRNIQNRDAVATSIFKRLPPTAKYLKLPGGKRSHTAPFLVVKWSWEAINPKLLTLSSRYPLFP